MNFHAITNSGYDILPSPFKSNRLKHFWAVSSLLFRSTPQFFKYKVNSSFVTKPSPFVSSLLNAWSISSSSLDKWSLNPFSCSHNVGNFWKIIRKLAKSLLETYTLHYNLFETHFIFHKFTYIKGDGSWFVFSCLLHYRLHLGSSYLTNTF